MKTASLRMYTITFLFGSGLMKAFSRASFKKIRKYSSHKNGAEKGSEEAFKHRIYLHIYFNKSRQTDDKTALDDDLYELKTLLESGTAIDDLSPAAKEKANKYFTVKRWGGKITATANNKAIKDANKYHG